MLLELDLGLLADYLFPILGIVASLAAAYFKGELSRLKLILDNNDKGVHLELDVLLEKIDRLVELSNIANTERHHLRNAVEEISKDLHRHIIHIKSYDKRLDRLERKAGLD